MKFNKYEFKKDFIFKNNQIYLTSSGFSKIKNRKKITGSRLGAILGSDSFTTPFQMWCEMLGFFSEDRDEYFLKAGQIIEPKILEYIKKKLDMDFVNYPSEEINFDLFQENKVFGGVPDGELFDECGKVSAILEIKTASLDKYSWVYENNQWRLKLDSNGKPIIARKGGGLSKWFKFGGVSIPENYKDQLSLYLYLRGLKKGYFCVLFLSEQDYLNPEDTKIVSNFNNYENYDQKSGFPKSEHLLIWREFLLNLEEFEKKIKFADKWYQDHILEGVSPELTTTDLSWFKYGYPNLN